MAREKVYVDRDGNVVEADDPSAAFIYDAADAKRLGYVSAAGTPDSEGETDSDTPKKKRG